MMNDRLGERILEALQQRAYQPLKPKALARKLGVGQDDYGQFRVILRQLVHQGRIELGSRHTLRLASAHRELVGVFRSIQRGGGFVRPRPGQGTEIGEIYVRAKDTSDAASGDVVLVAVRRMPKSPDTRPLGRILQVLERAASRFVGTYRTSEGEGLVRVDGRVFHEEIYVGPAESSEASDGDKVVFEMVRFPSPEMTGEGTIVEVLGKRGRPAVDLVSVIRQFQLPDEFPPDVLEEAAELARRYPEQKADSDRLDLTNETVVTIDPPDAHDFDDAIGLARDERGFWRLGVHIADVSHFVPAGSALDGESRRRGTSVYLPGKVLPMLPEVLSNDLASLREGQERLAKSVLIELDPQGRITSSQIVNSVIRVRRRLTYDQVSALWNGQPSPQAERAGRRGHGHRPIEPEIRELLDHMRELASILRERRRHRGFLELDMPEAVVELDRHQRTTGAHYAPSSDASHQLVEEFMLTANEVVADTLAQAGTAFLRRTHDLPDPIKLRQFAEFARTLGFRIDDFRSRFALQRVLREAGGTPQQQAIHFALLRSLKLAVYSPEEVGHWALASDCYCHFTSPIRRYPDLLVHRLLDRLIRRGRTSADHAELVGMGEHCSFTERRAEQAERELVKLKILQLLEGWIGKELDMVVSGVEDYGFYVQGTSFPAEGLVHIRTLTDDFYELDRAGHALVGKRTGRTYRLGDPVRCVIWRVDQVYRQLDLRLAEKEGQPPEGTDQRQRVPRSQPPRWAKYRRRR